MTVPHLNGQSDTIADPYAESVVKLLSAEQTANARLRAELGELRAEYERAAAAETALRLELARVQREVEERAVRLMRADELLASRNGSDATP